MLCVYIKGCVSLLYLPTHHILIRTHTHLPRVDMNRLPAVTTVAGAMCVAAGADENGAADGAPAVPPLPATVAAARAKTGVRAKMVLSMMDWEEGA